MTFQLRRFDSFYKKLWKLNLEKNMYLKKYKNKYKILSRISSKKISAHDKESKNSPKHTFLRGIRKEQKKQTA